MYGSHASGLCLPSSDIDLVIIPSSSGVVLETVREAVVCSPGVQTAITLQGASMPILKLECSSPHGVTKLDITVQDARHQGVKSVNLIKVYLRSYPQLEGLVLVFKYILKLAELNDPYRVVYPNLIMW